jgi:hypothetical protein
MLMESNTFIKWRISDLLVLHNSARKSDLIGRCAAEPHGTLQECADHLFSYVNIICLLQIVSHPSCRRSGSVRLRLLSEAGKVHDLAISTGNCTCLSLNYQEIVEQAHPVPH